MKSAATGFAIIFGLLLASVTAFAQVPGHIQYDFSGTGALTTSPVLYSGSITAGEPLLVGGTWSLSINDTGWPSDSNKSARWTYIDANYFGPNFDPFIFAWTAVFDNNTTASAPSWTTGRNDTGTLVGTAVIQLTIQDFDFDSAIDPDERAFMLLSGTIIVVKMGTGIWAGYCGLGSYSGFTENLSPATFADDSVTGSSTLDIEDCSVATREVTWGQIKTKYE